MSIWGDLCRSGIPADDTNAICRSELNRCRFAMRKGVFCMSCQKLTQHSSYQIWYSRITHLKFPAFGVFLRAWRLTSSISMMIKLGRWSICRLAGSPEPRDDPRSRSRITRGCIANVTDREPGEQWRTTFSKKKWKQVILLNRYTVFTASSEWRTKTTAHNDHVQ